MIRARVSMFATEADDRGSRAEAGPQRRFFSGLTSPRRAAMIPDVPVVTNGRLSSVRQWVVAVVAAGTLVGVSPAASATPPETDINQAGAKAIPASGDWLAAGVGGVWLSDPPARVIRRLDPASGAISATVRVPSGPCEATDVGFGALWTATCNRPGLARIDPVRNIQKGFVSLSIPGTLDGEGSVGAGAGGVWLVVDDPGCFACRVARVNPKTMKVVAKVPVRPNAASVRVGYGAVWVTNPSAGLLKRSTHAPTVSSPPRRSVRSRASSMWARVVSGY